MTARQGFFLAALFLAAGVLSLSQPPPKQEPKYPAPIDGSVPVSAP